MPRKKRHPYTLKQAIALAQFLGRHSTLLWVMFILASGWYAYEVAIARPKMAFHGIPQTSDWRDLDSWFRVLRNDGFILGYSDLRGNPLWVMYRLHPIPDDAPKLTRPSHFNPDWRAFNLIDHDSYTGSGYDRGHMAPNYAISRLYGAQAQSDSFLMTNITPQKANLNQKLWQRLEGAEIDSFARQFGQVWVITGPVFDADIQRLSSFWYVEIPDAFYKIYAAESASGKLTAIAFLVPQSVTGKEPPDSFLTDIDTIEAKTGLDFFPTLDDNTESQLESSRDSQAWPLPNRH